MEPAHRGAYRRAMQHGLGFAGRRRRPNRTVRALQALAYNQPFCRAKRYASTRLAAFNFPMASDR